MSTAETLAKHITMGEEAPGKIFRKPLKFWQNLRHKRNEFLSEYRDLRAKVRQAREEGETEILLAKKQVKSIKEQVKNSKRLFNYDMKQTVLEAEEVLRLTKERVTQRVERTIHILNDEQREAMQLNEILRLEEEIEAREESIRKLRRELGEPEPERYERERQYGDTFAYAFEEGDTLIDDAETEIENRKEEAGTPITTGGVVWEVVNDDEL